MKNYRFYAEMPEARKSKSASKAFPFFPWTVGALRERAGTGFRTCVTALYLDGGGKPERDGSGTMGAIAPAIDGNHFSYGYCSVSPDYLRKRTVRIPEELARALSPELFAYLDR